jgi:calcium permeable stress-gated cation channel
VAFSVLRPYNQNVYAPKLKHADLRHAPPPIGKNLWSWVTPLWRTREQDLVAIVGLDATVFLRFTRMCRNLFVVLSVVGCGILVPVNLSKSLFKDTAPWLSRITPLNVWNEAQWAQVVAAYLINFIVCGFLWWNYRKVLLLRRGYYESEDYQKSLHARTLMVWRCLQGFAVAVIPNCLRSMICRSSCLRMKVLHGLSTK